MDKTTQERIIKNILLGKVVYYNGHTVELNKYKGYIVDDGEATFPVHCMGFYSLIDYLES